MPTRTRSAQSTTPAFNTPSRTTRSATAARVPTDAEAFAIEGLLQMQAQPQPQATAVPPPPTIYVPSPSEVRARTAEPPAFGSTRKNILNLSDETWAGVTTGKRELLGIVAWLVARFGKDSDIVLKCYQVLPYIREPPSYPALPLGWKPEVDELGRRFYVNQVTGKSQWCRPKDAVPDYMASATAPAPTSFLTGIPFTPRGFPYRMVSNEVPAETTAYPDTPKPKETDPEWRPRWPTTMPDTSTPRRSTRIRTMSERTAPVAAAPVAGRQPTETETAPNRRRSTRQTTTAAPVRRSTRLASRA